MPILSRVSRLGFGNDGSPTPPTLLSASLSGSTFTFTWANGDGYDPLNMVSANVNWDAGGGASSTSGMTVVTATTGTKEKVGTWPNPWTLRLLFRVNYNGTTISLLSNYITFSY